MLVINGFFDLMDKEVNGASTENSRGTMATQLDFKGSGGENATAYAGVKEYKLFLRACLKGLTKGGKKGHVITSPRPAPPSIHLHAHKNGDRMDPPNFTEAWNNPPFSTLYSWEKLMDLNCITGEAARSREFSRDGGGNEVPNLAEAEQKWNSDLTERRIIPL